MIEKLDTSSQVTLSHLEILLQRVEGENILSNHTFRLEKWWTDGKRRSDVNMTKTWEETEARQQTDKGKEIRKKGWKGDQITNDVRKQKHQMLVCCWSGLCQSCFLFRRSRQHLIFCCLFRTVRSNFLRETVSPGDLAATGDKGETAPYSKGGQGMKEADDEFLVWRKDVLKENELIRTQDVGRSLTWLTWRPGTYREKHKSYRGRKKWGTVFMYWSVEKNAAEIRN